MNVRNWRDWFVEHDAADQSAYVMNDEADAQSGSRHKDFDKLELRRKQPPRCAKCKRFMGHDDGMYILISSDWRVHIHCFSEVLERHFEKGEAIDLTTGQIVPVDAANVVRGDD